ncbi:hypothetical protein F9889_02630 [Glaesserella parasuis]|nr:hypothetical protein [Glaesserella parasuis]
MYHVSLFSDFGKMGSFFVHISKRGLKPLYYKALSHFLATNFLLHRFITAHNTHSYRVCVSNAYLTVLVALNRYSDGFGG